MTPSSVTAARLRTGGLAARRRALRAPAGRQPVRADPDHGRQVTDITFHLVGLGTHLFGCGCRLLGTRRVDLRDLVHLGDCGVDLVDALGLLLAPATPSLAGVKLITLPPRERVEIQLDNRFYTLVEEAGTEVDREFAQAVLVLVREGFESEHAEWENNEN